MIEAAGVVLIRNLDAPRVLVIHRSHRGDWSLPKGKLDPGETAAIAAVRETLEETGYLVKLQAALTPVTYHIQNQPKTVYYWIASELADDPSAIPNDEVDELRWVTLAEAAELLTYPRDLTTVAEALAIANAGIKTTIVLRHAISTKRDAFDGEDDSKRPLAPEGFSQLPSIATLLSAYGVTRLISSPAIRCHQTLTSYAELEELEIEQNPLLLEENEDFTESEWRTLSSLPGAAICTHRPVIDHLAQFEPEAAQLLLNLPPAGMVVLNWNRLGELISAERHEI